MNWKYDKFSENIPSQTLTITMDAIPNAWEAKSKTKKGMDMDVEAIEV